MPFTPQQTARGLLTTFDRGDYSLMIARLKEAPLSYRDTIFDELRRHLSLDELRILKRYDSKLFWWVT